MCLPRFVLVLTIAFLIIGSPCFSQILASLTPFLVLLLMPFRARFAPAFPNFPCVFLVSF